MTVPAAHLAMAGYLRCRDPGRPVHYEGGGSRTAATDFVCPMYARVHQARPHPFIAGGTCRFLALEPFFPKCSGQLHKEGSAGCLRAASPKPARFEFMLAY